VLLKDLHVACAVTSVTLFALRCFWKLTRPARLGARWVRIVPHVIDTAFLGSGIALAIRLHQYPFVHAWLTAKVLAMILYIVLGIMTLRYANSRMAVGLGFAASVAVFFYIVGVAVTRDPMSWPRLVVAPAGAP
jgi:uncharacterized membrane protein SirB2